MSQRKHAPERPSEHPLRTKECVQNSTHPATNNKKPKTMPRNRLIAQKTRSISITLTHSYHRLHERAAGQRGGVLLEETAGQRGGVLLKGAASQRSGVLLESAAGKASGVLLDLAAGKRRGVLLKDADHFGGIWIVVFSVKPVRFMLAFVVQKTRRWGVTHLTNVM